MIVILQGIPDYVFSSALSEFYFSTDAASASFRLTKGSEVILEENYVPDGNGQIVVYDLQRLIEPYLRTNLKETLPEILRHIHLSNVPNRDSTYFRNEKSIFVNEMDRSQLAVLAQTVKENQNREMAPVAHDSNRQRNH